MAVWILKPCSSNDLHFIAAHVDDMVCGGSLEAVQQTKDHLRHHFQICDLGSASMFIGLRLSRDRLAQRIRIDQNHYTRDVLDLYAMTKCNPCLVPITSNTPLSKALPSEQLNASQTTLYQAIIGSLNYLMNCSRPNLAYAVNHLPQFASCLAEQHILAVKRVLCYLRHTPKSHLLLGPVSSSPDSTLSCLHIQGWFDASWADNPDDRHSTFGYALVYGSSGLLWNSKKYRATTLSTTDAEYVVVTELTRELSFIRNIFEEFGIPFVVPINLYGDNVNANNLANSM